MGLLVVGICGHNRTGKDTAASVMAAFGGFTRVGLADGVREAFGGLDGPTWEFRKDLDAAGTDNRTPLKLLGTECREDALCPDHWIDHVILKVRYASRYHPSPRSRFVVPDVRYPREVDGLRERVLRLGGAFEAWKVVRPGRGPTTGHPSELQVDAIRHDRLLSNDGTRRQFVDRVLAALEQLQPGGRPDAH